MRFLHHGLPKTIRQAEWWPDADPSRTTAGPQSPSSNSAIRNPQSTIRNPQSAVPNPRSYVAELQQRLRNPTTASKHWVIRQYDHEVQAGSVVKPLVGVGDGPSDAAVLRPRLSSDQGIALGCGLAPQLGDVDPYWMAVAAVDEALRNVVCVGGDPSKTAILDNFCWPGVDDPRSLGALVRACQACYDVATAYGLPFISGKDSLNNEFALNDADAAMLRRVFADRWPGLANIPPPGCESPTTDPQSPIPKPQSPNRLAIPYTLLISAVSLIEDVNRCITAAPRLVEKKARLFYVGLEAADWSAARLDSTTRLHATVAGLIRSGQVLTAHDCSEGGIAVAVAEMALASDLDTQYLLAPDGPAAHPFAEPPSGYILQATDPAALETSARTIPGVVVQEVARLTPPGGEPRFEFFPAQSATRLDATDPPEPIASVSLADLRRAWTAPLDW
jgi:phosphoribosylformylglycinamidine synthase